MKNTQKIKKEISKQLLIKYVVSFLISLFLFIVFLDFGREVKGLSGGIYFDQKIISYISKNVTPRIKSIMIFISFLGSAKFYIPIYLTIVAIFIKKKKYLYSIALVNGVLGSALLNFLVKRHYIRVRPEKYFQIKEVGFSFPSGHSMVAISSYFILTYLLFREKSWSLKKVISWLSTVVLVLSIGFSRIYLGVHWPTDVIAGLSLGFIWVSINIIIIETFSLYSNEENKD